MAGIYNSNYTGEQIDDAVGKVINNEVGGGMKLEGSAVMYEGSTYASFGFSEGKSYMLEIYIPEYEYRTITFIPVYSYSYIPSRSTPFYDYNGDIQSFKYVGSEIESDLEAPVGNIYISVYSLY